MLRIPFLALIMSLGLLAQADSPPPPSPTWQDRFLEAMGLGRGVERVLDEASAAATPEARRFLTGMAEKFPKGKWSVPALEALARDRGSAFPALVMKLIRKTPRPADKQILLALLERAEHHRTVGLRLMLELLHRHRADDFGLSVLSIVQRYLADPDGADARAIADVLMRIFSDPDKPATASAAFRAALELPDDMRIPFLVTSVETLDPGTVDLAARELIAARPDGVEDLLVETLVRSDDESTRLDLLTTIRSHVRPIFWLRLVERLEPFSWSSLDSVRRLMEGVDPRVDHFLASCLDGSRGVKATVLALHHVRGRRIVAAREKIEPLLESGAPHVRILAHVVASDLDGNTRTWDRCARWLLSGKLDDRLDRLEALAEIGIESEPVRRWMRTVLGTRSTRWPIHAALIHAAGRSRFPDLAALCAPLLASDRWQLRLAAIEALGEGGDRAGLPLLVQALKDDHSRLAHAAGRSLYRLTGRDLGAAWSSWSAYVTSLPQDWRPLHLPRSSKVADAYGPSFYGLSLQSNRVVFVCDLSGSMAGGKLEKLKGELERAIGGFDDKGMLNVVFFEDGVSGLWSRITPSRKSNRRYAVNKVKKKAAHGGTNLWGGLARALKDPKADTICLLSDGAPSAGKITDARSILEETRRRNRYKRMAIHTIFVTQGGDLGMFQGGVAAPSLMRELAEQNEGKHVLAR